MKFGCFPSSTTDEERVVSHRLRNEVNGNVSVFHGLCTFLVIFYTQASKTSFLF